MTGPLAQPTLADQSAPQSSDPQAFGPASPSKRLGAPAIDLVIVAAACGLIWILRPSVVLVALTALQLLIVAAVAISITGRSLGAAALKTAILLDNSTQTPGLAKASIHTILSGIMAVTLIGLVASTLTGKNGRGWIERATGTQIVDLTQPVYHSGSGYERAGTGYASISTPNSNATPLAPSGFAAVDSAKIGSPLSTPSSTTPPAIHGSPTQPLTTGATYQPVAPQYAAQKRQPPATPTLPEPAPAPQAHPAVATVTPPTPAAPAQAHPAPSPPTAAAPTLPEPAPPTPAHTSAPKAASRNVWAVMDSGEQERVDSLLVLGRAPKSNDPNSRLVTIADSTRSLSRTHLRLGPTRSGVWVEDAFSANGTSARTPDGTVVELPRGQRRSIPIGTVLIMGERTLTITANTDQH
ncbi:RDD family protein [Schaalia vaccimaxillae]|uniref:RDD family protein n=1 Tax=Schaalia vaccimaxillae TaxID=183916 RepID=UPI0003B4262D|nr:RDD family protein [Schaalia vaccimaxillae]